jgi:hypothetical protein
MHPQATPHRAAKEGKTMKVLIACEYSGTVRDAFIRLGHDAVSCDLLPSEKKGPHIKGDVFGDIIYMGHKFDLIIAHPPCTHLAVSGARWFKDKKQEQESAITFFMRFTKLNCMWAIENPIGIMSRIYRKPDQIIQPWQFGHGETKATCLWLNGLPKLVPTNIVPGREARIHKMPHRLTAGKNGAAPIRGLRKQWPSNGEAPSLALAGAQTANTRRRQLKLPPCFNVGRNTAQRQKTKGV